MTDIYYFDWSHGKVTTLKNDEDEIVNFYSLFDLLNSLTEPSVLIGEATFESFFRDTRRNEFIERCADEGHTILTTPNRTTGRQRDKMGLEKNDDNDARAIRALAKSGIHLKKPRVFDANDSFIEVQKAANKELMLLRASKVRVPKKNGIGYLKATKSNKEFFAEQLIEQLPDFDSLDGITKKCLGNQDGYNKVIVAAVGVAAKHVSSRQKFEKLAGLYHHGYPSQIRSDLTYWGYSRRIRGRISITEYRKALRWLFGQLKLIVGHKGSQS